MVIFWDKSSTLLSEYLPGGTMISGSYYASIIERLRCAIVEKRGGKVAVVVDGNASADPGQCFLEAVFPCISRENREKTRSIRQETCSI